MIAPTSRQLEVLRFIHWEIAHRGYPPTWREIMVRIGVCSTNAVHDHIAALCRKGLLEREQQFDPAAHGRKRSMRVTPAGKLALGASVTEPTTQQIGRMVAVKVYDALCV
jgi:repressor LexA